jgi:hypothetical protein
MVGCDRVHVRQVEDGDRPKIVRAVLADLADLQPTEQRSQCIAIRGGDPGDRLARRRPSHGRRTHPRTGERVEQAGLPDAGAADEREHVRV